MLSRGRQSSWPNACRPARHSPPLLPPPSSTYNGILIEIPSACIGYVDEGFCLSLAQFFACQRNRTAHTKIYQEAVQLHVIQSKRFCCVICCSKALRIDYQKRVCGYLSKYSACSGLPTVPVVPAPVTLACRCVCGVHLGKWGCACG